MTKTKRASQQELAELHVELATVLKKAVRFTDDTGAPVAALLSVARQFLKDNKIEADDPPGSHLRELEEALPDFPEDSFPETAGPAH